MSIIFDDKGSAITEFPTVDGEKVMPVDIKQSELPDRAAKETTLSAINTKLVTGTDIGDVTINNGIGNSAVPIKDGGNSITVDGTFWQTTQPVSFTGSTDVYGGFREGEVLGIHVEDVDLENRVINVRHSVVTLKGGLVIAEPKTESSKRAVTLPKIAYEELKRHIEQLERKQGLIFTTGSGKPISPRNLIRHFKQAIKSAGLPDIRITIYATPTHPFFLLPA